MIDTEKIHAPTPQRAEMPAVEPAHTRMVQELKHTSPLIGCRFDPSGEFVFAGAQDNSIQRWHLATGKKTALIGHKSWVRALAFAEAEKRLFSASWDGKILAWPLDAESPAPGEDPGRSQGLGASLGRQSQRARCWPRAATIIWSSSGRFRIYGRFAPSRATLPTSTTSAFHPAGASLVSGDLKGMLKVWDIKTGKEERTLEAKLLHRYDVTFGADIGGVRAIAFDAAGGLLACAGITDVSNAFAGVGKPVVVLFDFVSGKIKQTLRPRENFQGTAWGVAFHPAGFVVGVGGGNGGALWYWKPDAAADVFALKLPNNARDLDLHPDGKRLAVPFFDGAVRVYDLSKKA